MDGADRLRLAEVRLKDCLWRLPLLTDREIPVALGIPASTWQAIKATGLGPKLFTLGRRVYARTSDLRKWLEVQP